jgi:hypothetical protein
MVIPALGALLAIAVVVLVLLALPGTSATSTPTRASGASAPLIQYYGTGAPPTRPQTAPAQVHQNAPVLHAFGPVH